MLSSKLWAVVLVCGMGLLSHDASAKRIGGGLSFGKQSTNVTQRATPATQPQTAPAARPVAANPANAAAPAPKRPWGSMLGGLAAGLGLAWLASSLGLGEGFAQVLMLGLVLLAGIALFRLLTRRREPSKPVDGMVYQTAVPGGGSVPRGYSPQNVGNDASARPWERNGPSVDAGTAAGSQGGSMIGSALVDKPVWGMPAGFDVDGFLKASKTNFVTLQDAWDRSDIPALRAMMTDGMLEQIKSQLSDREASAGGTVSKTEVVMLEAQLLGIEELDGEYMASVEFSGLIREEFSAGPNPFREVWNITRPQNGPGGWLVAGVQALD